MATVVVVPYDPAWPREFAALRDRLARALGDRALAIEHVGSTAVPGLAAKPIIDIDVVVRPGRPAMAEVIERLARAGYVHRGDLGIEGREAFRAPPGTFAHHLYACPDGSLGLRNHLALRDYLRADHGAAAAYGEAKAALAAEFPDDIEAYVRGKTAFILGLLGRAGLPAVDLEAIRQQNTAVFGGVPPPGRPDMPRE